MTTEIELFYSPYCKRCAAARRWVHEFATAPRHQGVVYRERNVLEDLERAVELGVKATPALAVSGRLIAVARWNKQAVRALLDPMLSLED